MKSIICAIVKDEQLFIREWVEWNLAKGFDAIYIYEDYGSKSHKEYLKDYIKKGKVFLTAIEGSGLGFTKRGVGGADASTQGQLYRWFLNKCKNKEIETDWLAFFDVDEFIDFEEGWDLNRLEEEFDDTPGILLSWVLYGANGHINRPKEGVVKSYTSHLPLGSIMPRERSWTSLKSLINIKNNEGYGTSFHRIAGCIKTDKIGTSKGPLCFEKAWINHYYTKSFEDYCNRMFSRGNMQNNFRDFDQFFYFNPELLPQKIEMLESVRYKHCASTMWISREEKLISGGNLWIIENLSKKLVARI